MSDVAQLGFAVETDKLVAANDALDAMAPAADKAGKATDKLNSSMSEGNKYTERFAQGLEHIGESVRENIVEAFKTAVTSFVAFFAIERLVDTLKETAEALDTTSKAARAMGSSFAGLQAVQIAGQLAGQAADAIDAAGKRMSKALGIAIASGKGTSGAFAELGISAQKLAAMPIDIRFATIADKIRAMGLDTASTTALLAKLGDRTGSLVTLFEEGGDSIRKATGEVVQFHLALSDAAGKAVEEMMDNFERLGFAIQGSFNQIVGAIAPVLGPIIGAIATGLAAVVGETGKLLPIIEQVAISMAIAFGPSVIASIYEMAVGIGTALVQAMLAFDVAADANPIGLIIGAIALAIYAVYGFRDAIKQALGIDVGAIIKTSVNVIIQLFMIGVEQIKFIWAAVPSAIGDATIGAANLVIKAINGMISGAIGGINYLIGAIKNIPGLGDKVNLIDPKLGNIPEMVNNAGQGMVDAAAKYQAAVAKIRGTDYVAGIVANFKGIGDGAAEVTTKLGGATGALGQMTDAEVKSWNDIKLSATDKIAQNENIARSLGTTAEQTEYLAEKQDLLNQAMKAGLNLTPEMSAELDALAKQEAKTAANAAALKDIYDTNKQAFTGFFTGLAQNIEQGKDLWSSLADAATNALDSILNKAIEMMANSAFDALWTGGGSSGTSGGGLGSIISSVLGFTTSGGGLGAGSEAGGLGSSYAKGGAFPGGISGYSNSVVNRPTTFRFAAGAGLMGEAGPEAVMPLKRTASGSLGVQVANDNSRGGNTVVNIYNSASDQVTATAKTNSAGELNVFIDRVVADNLKNPGSASHKAAARTFGLTQATKAR